MTTKIPSVTRERIKDLIQQFVDSARENNWEDFSESDYQKCCEFIAERRIDHVTIPTNAFFNLLAESSWDRPAAWRYFCKLQSIPDDRHLAMRSWDKTWEADLKYLEGIFGKGKIPSELTDGEWDT